MSQYARSTTVSSEKSRAEIETICRRYGASEFASGWKEGKASVQFSVRDRKIRFILPLPDPMDVAFQLSPRGRPLLSNEASRRWEQACRQRWRALVLSIKAKLEAIESGISTFDQEMLPFIVLPGGQTIAETILPDLPQIISGGQKLLPAPEN